MIVQSLSEFLLGLQTQIFNFIAGFTAQVTDAVAAFLAVFGLS